MYSTTTLLQAKDTNTLEDLHTALSSTNYCLLPKPYFTCLLQAKDINTLEDLNKAFPGQVDQIREWFRYTDLNPKP